MVKVGIKSVPGRSSSKNAKTDPLNPNLFLPKQIRKTMAETGAHTRSDSSPIRGKEKLA